VAEVALPKVIAVAAPNALTVVLVVFQRFTVVWLPATVGLFSVRVPVVAPIPIVVPAPAKFIVVATVLYKF